jgi:hypothetical protein
MDSLSGLAVGLVSLLVGALLGAVAERSRARAGYLAKQYREHLAKVFSFAIAEDNKIEATGDIAESPSLRTSILTPRSFIEADVWLFGEQRAREAIGKVHDRVLASSLERADAEELARVLRGPFYRRLAPQKRWFR